MIREELKKQLTSQLEYAREQKFRQDKMRFAFPAAFLVYLGSLTVIFRLVGTNGFRIGMNGISEIILIVSTIISGIIGIGIFFMSIIEHYHYAKNRDLEITIDNFLKSDLVHYENINEDEVAKKLIEGKRLDNLEHNKKNNRQENENYYPKLGQPTMIFILTILAVINGLLFGVGILLLKGNHYNWQAWVSITALIAAVQMLSFNYWQIFYKNIIEKIENFFNRKKEWINILIWFAALICLALWVCCTIK